MHLEKAENGELVITMPQAEAADALATLKKRADDLDECEELSKALENAGIQLPEQPDHIRHEYMPPADH
ncbi:hypothetical protein TVD_05240 [Thioalkalivibrio versutus]|uniref:Uncharacterized protein n=1 Tax=Thioalkalivibrio versutus TaxID=106634 RepID=A0A0G3G0R3_9GAMM|nr:hypothetical protein [Thioalkalivibrio versutus]AKJ94808.1 hypothetical protein TVD_05240 [Thioalkalivibrio versutus]